MQDHLGHHRLLGECDGAPSKVIRLFEQTGRHSRTLRKFHLSEQARIRERLRFADRRSGSRQHESVEMCQQLHRLELGAHLFPFWFEHRPAFWQVRSFRWVQSPLTRDAVRRQSHRVHYRDYQERARCDGSHTPSHPRRLNPRAICETKVGSFPQPNGSRPLYCPSAKTWGRFGPRQNIRTRRRDAVGQHSRAKVPLRP